MPCGFCWSVALLSVTNVRRGVLQPLGNLGRRYSLCFGAASVAWAVRISAVRFLLVLIEAFDIQVASTHGLLRIELRRLDRPTLVLPLKYLPSVWVLDGSFPACVCEVLERFVYQVR